MCLEPWNRIGLKTRHKFKMPLWKRLIYFIFEKNVISKTNDTKNETEKL